MPKVLHLFALSLLCLCTTGLIACTQTAVTQVPATVPATGIQPVEIEVPKLKVGDPAPQFTLGDIDNKPVSLSDFSGKKVVINLWIMGCHGCTDELPYLQEFHQKWYGQGAVLIGINTTDSIAIVRSYAASKGLKFTLLVDPGKKLNKSYSITGMPTTFFVDGKGVIKAIKDGSFESLAEIEEVYSSY